MAIGQATRKWHSISARNGFVGRVRRDSAHLDHRPPRMGYAASERRGRQRGERWRFHRSRGGSARHPTTRQLRQGCHAASCAHDRGRADTRMRPSLHAKRHAPPARAGYTVHDQCRDVGFAFNARNVVRRSTVFPSKISERRPARYSDVGHSPGYGGSVDNGKHS
jgi:hypothetical protein